MSYEDVLRETASRCRLASECLRECRHDVEAPWQSMIEQIATAEESLAASLSQFADEGPATLLATRIQYVSESGQKQRSRTVGGALKQLVQTNDEVRALVSQQAEKALAAEAAHETFQLSNKIDAVNRKISMIRQSSRDL